MKEPQTITALKHVLADSYALYIKTQNYHWNITGHYFKPLHELFETQYRELAEAIDEIAERIRALGERVEAGFKTYAQNSRVKDGDANADAETMLQDLYDSHLQLIDSIKAAQTCAEGESDAVSHDLLTERLAFHEKNAWMLKANME